MIKSVKCVNATKKKVYMLYDLEPDRTVTGIFEKKVYFSKFFAYFLKVHLHHSLKIKVIKK